MNSQCFNSGFKLNQKGQVFPYYLSMILVLIISWAMILNISKLMYERMMVQNAADNAALSMSAYHARTINMLMEINAMVARYMYVGTPVLPNFLLPGKNDKVKDINTREKIYGFGLYPKELGCGAGGGSYGSCLLVPGSIPQMIGALAPSFIGGDSVERVTNPLDVIGGRALCGRGTVIFGSSELKVNTAAMYRIIKMITDKYGVQAGLARQNSINSRNLAIEIAKRQEIDSSGNFCGADDLQVWPLSISLGLKNNGETIKFYGTRHSYFSVPPVFFGSGSHGHYVMPTPMPVETWDRSWYFYDPEFSSRKVTVMATKKADSSKDYPFLKRWFDIEWPDIKASASACSYNPSTEGNGFVKSPSSGKSKKIWEVIEAYNKGKSNGGGWRAHLIPTPLTLH